MTEFSNIIDFGHIKVLLEQSSDLRWHWNIFSYFWYFWNIL